MTGWGRAGDWFAVDHDQVRPDILTTAKGITGAYVPLGLTATTEEIFAHFTDHYFPHGHTYEAHPLTLAPGVAAIEEYRRLGLIEKSRRDGEYLLGRLREIAERHPSVGEVRGRGLFAAVELVKDRSTREPFNTEDDKLAGRPLVVDEVVQAMIKAGVYTFGWVSHILIRSPAHRHPRGTGPRSRRARQRPLARGCPGDVTGRGKLDRIPQDQRVVMTFLRV